MTAQPPAPYTVRPLTLDDADAYAALVNEHSQAYIGEPSTDAARLAGEWQAPGFELAATSLGLVAPDGALAGGLVVEGLEPYVEAVVWGVVAPAHRGPGLGAYLVRSVDGLARRALAQRPEGADAVVQWLVWVGDDGHTALLGSHGFAPVRRFWQMRIELDRPPAAPEWPEGIGVRVAGPDDRRAVYEVLTEAFRDHWGEDEESFEHFVHQRITAAGAPYDPELWFVATAGDEIAGAAICETSSRGAPECGYVRELGVLPAWRRRGIARALLLHAFSVFHARGAPAVSLHVDSDNPTGATALYEQAGMTARPTFDIWERPLASPAFAPGATGNRATMEREQRPDEGGWQPPEGDDVTEPEELAEAEPGMRQSPLRVEEQPDLEE